MNVVDYADLGRRVKAARIIAGHESVAAGCEAIRERTDLDIPVRTMYAIEKGAHSVTIEQYVAILAGYGGATGTGITSTMGYKTTLAPDLVTFRVKGGAVYAGDRVVAREVAAQLRGRKIARLAALPDAVSRSIAGRRLGPAGPNRSGNHGKSREQECTSVSVHLFLRWRASLGEEPI